MTTVLDSSGTTKGGGSAAVWPVSSSKYAGGEGGSI
jgi:hypothetical protein